MFFAILVNLATDDAYANLTSAPILATTTHIDSTISISSDTTKTSTISNSDVIGLTSNSTTSISTTTMVSTISTTVSTITTTIASDTINNTTAILTTSITATSSSTSMITSDIGDTVTATSNTDSTATTSTSTDILSPITSGANGISTITTNAEGTSTTTSNTDSATTNTTSTDTTTTTSSSTTTDTTSSSTTSSTTTTETTSSSTTTTTSLSTSTTTTTSSTTQTTTSSTTTTTTSSTSTTTTTINPCTINNYRWNTTGITVLDISFLYYPTDMYFDPNDTLYIVDELNQIIYKLLKNASIPTRIAGLLLSAGSNASQFSTPQGVYVDSKGSLYVTDYYNSRVQKFVNGSTLGITMAGINSSAGAALNQFNGLRYFAVDVTETYMYFTDYNNNRIMSYQMNSTTGTNGQIVAGGAGAGNTNTQLNSPWGISYLPTISNYLYITNNNGHSVMRWIPGASSGQFIAGTPGTSGSNAASLNTPAGIRVDRFLNMFIVDYGNHRVQMFCYNNTTATTIAGTGTAGNSATQLNAPKGIAFDSSMNLYISDTGNRRIQKFVKL
ncbi:unnamed protein product [Adineta steineri]|uniref:NHL repeat containing protein n=1 Tax=Adineta steineri TaxID=433720 RepID=A0A815P383_9BILA|nr:unnamed protein product [Adineta steineri]CAF4169965.1 unnamed protein product [Adineta steineri]